jgi:hypothetical protein
MYQFINQQYLSIIKSYVGDIASYYKLKVVIFYSQKSRSKQ